ncbi:MAG TPA: thiamine phosphate synthase [Candidatus Coprenecus pullistercoris]|nr:thiamine phosphate synthase [Candidatus Coprenecus pullistercoris]
MSFQVQFITHFTETLSYLDSVRIALEGGCRWIQLRMKHASADEVRTAAAQALPLCRQHGAVLILDDHVELVRECGADGVHLGMTDMPVAEARKILPREQYIIGGTANTLEDIRLHASGGADYIGCGPFRFTTTKDRDKLAPTLGLEGYRRIMDGMHREGLVLPVVGIGGVTAEDMPALAEAGLSGIALSGSILRADDPVAEMRRVMDIAASTVSE